jgi:spore germination cell wall hydrolase CwlJ-like protein
MKNILSSVALLFSAALQAADEIPTRDILAAVIVLEAAGEGYVGMQAVANVVQNRASREGGIRLVLLRPKQFSCLNGRSVDQAVAKALQSPVWAIAWSLAGEAMEGTLRDITGKATHYHAGKAPFWARSFRLTRRIGKHAFYHERSTR